MGQENVDDCFYLIEWDPIISAIFSNADIDGQLKGTLSVRKKGETEAQPKKNWSNRSHWRLLRRGIRDTVIETTGCGTKRYQFYSGSV